MNAENILRSDLLDIVFEDRNKQYGAYPLRKEYNKRLYLSIGLITSFVLVLFGWYYIVKHSDAEAATQSDPIYVADPILKKIDIEPQKPPPSQKKLPPVATVTNDPPRIVPDNQVTDTTKHSVTDLDNKVISDVSSDGPAATGDNQQASKNETAGPAATAAPEPAPEPAVIERAEVMPEFPGGMAALIRFLGKNLRVPEEVMEPGQKVRVPVKFVVNKDGDLSDVEFLTQPDNAFKKEIMRVMGKMPKWKPGLQHGKAVAVYYTIPIIFDISEN